MMGVEAIHAWLIPSTFRAFAWLIWALVPVIAWGQSDKDFKQEEKEREISSVYIEACTQMMRGDLSKATELFTEVLSLEEAHHAALYNLAKISLEQRDYDQAVIYGTQALDLDPDNYWYYEGLREAYNRKGNLAKAIEVQERLVNRFPEKGEEYLTLAELFDKNGQPEEALARLETLESKVGPNEESVFRKYHLYKDLNQIEASLAALKQLVRINSTNTHYFRLLYEDYAQNGRKEEAVQLLENLLEEDPNNGFALLTLADYYKGTDQIEKSDAYLFRAFENPDIPPEGKVRIINGLITYAENTAEVKERVMALIRILVNTHEASGSIYAVQGEMMAMEGRYDSARVFLRKSLDLNPMDTETWYRLIYTSYRQRDYQQMFLDAEEAVEYFPNDENFLFFYGISGSRTGNFDQAVYALEKIRKKPDPSAELMPQVLAELGRIYGKQGVWDRSDEAFDEAIALAPEDDVIMNAYAYSLAIRAAQLDKAASLIQKAIELNPDVPTYLDTYGWVLYQQGKYKESEKWLRAAVEKGRNGEILEHYGDVLFKLGQKDAAIAQWEAAIELGASLNIEEKINKNP